MQSCKTIIICFMIYPCDYLILSNCLIHFINEWICHILNIFETNHVKKTITSAIKDIYNWNLSIAIKKLNESKSVSVFNMLKSPFSDIFQSILISPYLFDLLQWFKTIRISALKYWLIEVNLLLLLLALILNGADLYL